MKHCETVCQLEIDEESPDAVPEAEQEESLLGLVAVLSIHSGQHKQIRSVGFRALRHLTTSSGFADIIMKHGAQDIFAYPRTYVVRT